MMQKVYQTACLIMVFLALSACSTQTVKSTTFTPAVVDDTPLPEEQLLDVGISIFNPGLDELDEDQEELTFADVRQAETYFTSYMLSSALQSTGNWGVVRVIPADSTSPDVLVKGTLLQSDGETMLVRIDVSDATGRRWFSKEYEESVSRYSYDPRLRRNVDAFQGLYNKIANDMLEYRRRNLKPSDMVEIRTVSKIMFAQDFAPDVYDEYLEQGRNGRIDIKRLPAANDPIMLRIEGIRERDNLYVDTLQDYYSNFARQMATPYNEFRRLSYDEVMKLDKLEAEARRNMILGVAAIVGGLAATQSSNAAAPYATYGGIGGGAWLIKEAFATREEAQLHVEALAELGNSLEMAIAPKTIELEERTVTLSGNVQAQYEQWREILADIYASEVGETQQQIQQ